MTDLLFIIACASALAWVPVFLYFFRNWRSRRNPISLAICTLIGFPIYAVLFSYWMIYNIVPNVFIAGAMVGANFIICMAFYLSFYLSSKRFNDERGK